MTTKLRLYNGALFAIGERPLATLTDSVESRRALDEKYQNFVDYVLQQGYWKCALRTSRIDYDPSVTVSFGYQNAFVKPSDHVKLFKFASDEFLNHEVTQRTEDSSWWFASLPTVYVQYVSNSASYGADLSKWSAAMATYGELLLASWIVERLNPGMAKEGLRRDMKQALDNALAKDAMEGPAVFAAPSGWATARGGYGWRANRGNWPNMF